MKLKDLLDPRCRQHWLRLWSNHLALLAGAAAAWIVENPGTALGFIQHIEQPWRSGLTFLITAGIPIIVRMLKQPALVDAPEGK